MTPVTRIPVRERLIHALDLPTAAQALARVDRLGDAVAFYKVGMELMAAGALHEVIDALAQRGKRIFVDLKFLDIPATVAAAVQELSRRPVSLCTVHAQHPQMLRAAVAAKGALRLLGVTVLTSIDDAELRDEGIAASTRDLVLARARMAAQCGIDGVVASGHEARAIRAALGPGVLIVCPGVRPAGDAAGDQKRTVDVAAAFAHGADYIVVGRPIAQAPDPRAAAEAIQSQVAAAM
ncbi:MAG TPA: orotidine-5'-phosphate decarboxylase [Xanthomonadaceae bacterium]|nr:orotidine-5'-phosphate decarboxylase [Xanthomonadaceae bacterium]